MTSTGSDREVVEQALEVLLGLSGKEVAALFPDEISANDVHRWRRGEFKRLSAGKRRFLVQLREVWESEGRCGAYEVAARMGTGPDDQVEALKHFISHPALGALGVSGEQRLALGRRMARDDGFSVNQLRAFESWCVTVSRTGTGAHDQSGKKDSQGNTVHSEDR